MKSLALIFLVAIASVFFFSSCKKITQDQLINGVWKLQEMYIDSSTQNYVTQFPFYTGNNCCTYKIDFQKSGIILAYYLTYDTFNYISYGSWELLEADQLYFKVDKYFDGTFKIEEPGTKHWRLTSEANHIKAFDGINTELDTTYTKLELYKN